MILCEHHSTQPALTAKAGVVIRLRVQLGTVEFPSTHAAAIAVAFKTLGPSGGGDLLSCFPFVHGGPFGSFWGRVGFGPFFLSF